jgi:multicomponent Na+:H+ antiporter subunit E
MVRGLTAFVGLYLFWLALSGNFTVFLVSAGAACVLAVLWFARRMDVLDAEGVPIELGWRVFGYWLWLFKEVVKSAWDVSCIVVNPKLPISPTWVRFKPRQRTIVGLVLHANSITLTPGTITVDAQPDEFLVHALTKAGAAGVTSGDMDRRVSACEART